MAKLYPSFRRHIIESKSILPGERVVVSVSGGIDSMVMLDLITRISRPMDVTPVVAHANHKLRGRESDHDEEFVRDVAHEMNLRCVVKSLKPGGHANTQDEARHLRQEFLRETAESLGADAICLGHNRGDQAETILMHLMRGAGLSGLGGMEPKTTIGGLVIARPILFASRHEIESYARERGIEHREDSTNARRAYRRNELRHTILPALAKINPNIEECLSDMGDRVREEDAVLNEIAAESYEESLIAEDGDSVSLSRRHYREMPPAIRRRILRLAYIRLTGSGADLNADQLSRMDQISESEKSCGEYRLKAPWRFERAGEVLRIAKAPPRPGSQRRKSR